MSESLITLQQRRNRLDARRTVFSTADNAITILRATLTGPQTRQAVRNLIRAGLFMVRDENDDGPTPLASAVMQALADESLTDRIAALDAKIADLDAAIAGLTP